MELKPAVHRQWGLQVVLGVALIVLMFTVTGTLIRVAFGKFEEMAHEGVRVVFSQQVRQIEQAFAELVGRAESFVDVGARLGFADALRDPQRGELERRWTAALAVNTSLRSLHLASSNGQSFNITALRGTEAQAAHPQAPAGTRYAVRIVMRAGDARRGTERWRYLDGDGVLLGQRVAATDFDVRGEPLYRAAMAQTQVVYGRTAASPAAIGGGLRVARQLGDGSGVLAADIAMDDLGRLLAGMTLAPHSAAALVEPAGHVVAVGAGVDGPALAPQMLGGLMGASGHPALRALAAWQAPDRTPEVRVHPLAGDDVVMAQATVALSPGERWRVVSYAPLSPFLGFMHMARDRMALFGLLVLLVALVTALLLTDRLVSSLNALATDAGRIRHLDFGPTPQVRSRLREFDTLAHAHAVMKESIRSGTQALHSSRQRLEDLIAAGLAMSGERDKMRLLQQILWGAKRLTHCDAVTLFIVTEQRTLRFALRTRDDALPKPEIALVDENGQENLHFVSAFAALRNQHVVIDDVYAETRFDLSGTRSFDAQSGYRTVSMLALPLAPREGEVIGVLQLMNAIDPATGQVVPFDDEAVRLASALAAQAAVSLDNHQLVQAQADLVDSMVRLLAGAIDAKSPYTGGHCERVPELAFMLAEEATRATTGPLASFSFDTPAQWREFRIGAWLHDCGKITTPEYVVDKATKLETIYDRIHEIRTRFEVLWRDAEIERLQAVLDGEDPAAARARCDARQQRLREDFAFLAECNLGTERMAQDHVDRLRTIGAQTWWRHFDDRLGIAHGALESLREVPPEPLPVAERLLDDKPQHLVERPPTAALDPRHGFKMEVPQYLYNRGELHNLSVRSGTLTTEERYKINEHIMQTIVMLDAMNFPKDLRRVPEYAGTHHENLTGKGYPRGLAAEQLSVPARIMAVADIFEALTASDRPYKRSNTLSEAVEILWGFKRRGHIDPDVFDLFLTSGVYRRFAERFLSAELIDEVDIARYIGPVPPRLSSPAGQAAVPSLQVAVEAA